MKRFFLLFALFLGTIEGYSAQGGLPTDREHNAIYLCENGLEMFDLAITLIRRAESRIEIAGCIMGGSICQQLLTELQNRLKEVPDLVVNVMGCPIILENEDRDKINELKALFPNRFNFLYTHDIPVVVPNFATIHCHIKFVVIDERYFSYGGTNFDEVLCSDGRFTPPKTPRPGLARTNLQAGARDQDVVGVGPMAIELRKLFYTLWAMWDETYQGRSFNRDPDAFKDMIQVPPVAEDRRCYAQEFESNPKLLTMPSLKFIFSGPMHKDNLISQEYVRLINEAKSEIVIGNLYFNPKVSILDALKSASQRGVSTTLITNGPRDTSPMSCSYFCWANRINYVPMFYGRDYHFWETSKASSDPLRPVKIYEYLVNDILYHKKVLIVDRHIVILGSYNLGIKSDEWDYESVIIFDSEEMAADLLQILETDKSLSVEISPQEARSWYFDPVKSFLGMHQKQLHTFL